MLIEVKPVGDDREVEDEFLEENPSLSSDMVSNWPRGADEAFE